MKLSDGEKLILVMLCDIYKHMTIKDGVDPDVIQEAIYSGNTWGIKWKHSGVFDVAENSDSARSEVLNILDMWAWLERDFDALCNADKEKVSKELSPFNVRFYGFDHRDEYEYISIARFLINRLDRYTQFKDRELSGGPPFALTNYQRMHAVFEPIRASLGASGGSLSADQIIQIVKRD